MLALHLHGSSPLVPAHAVQAARMGRSLAQSGLENRNTLEDSLLESSGPGLELRNMFLIQQVALADSQSSKVPGPLFPAELPANRRSLPRSDRLASVDAYRGAVMLLMIAELCLRLPLILEDLPNTRFWRFLASLETHATWTGASLHDLIHPSFVFLVGVALPFSLAKRAGSGQTRRAAISHAAWRSLLLVILGIFLRSVGHDQTIYTFIDTLTQIGLGYLPLFLIALAAEAPALGVATTHPGRLFRAALPWMALALILVGYWAAFAMYPLPSAEFDYGSVGVPEDWEHHFSGFTAHWNKNGNFGAAFDRWFLNLFPRSEPFVYNPGGYSTLNFIPTIATMLLGLVAGGWIRDQRSGWHKTLRMLAAGVVCLVLAAALHTTGICPIIKRLWTPAWVLFSGGWALLILAGFYLIMDVLRIRSWGFPLRVVGMNSLAAYCLAELLTPFLKGSLQTHFGGILRAASGVYEPVLIGLGALAIHWLILYWMYRRGIFIKI
jgi:predicted acyltransferase